MVPAAEDRGFFPRVYSEGYSRTKHRIAVVIPCYCVKRHIESVIRGIGKECDLIFVIDDSCPEGTGRFVEEFVQDRRLTVIYHTENRGVGAAVMTGYRAAIEAGASIIVKIDGDGQMDPALLPRFVGPIVRGDADYTKGNRFFSIDHLRKMPRMRLVGNSILSFITKLSSGYWSIFDPTNGYTAIHAWALRQIELKNVSERYFFETDMLIKLGAIRAVVRDVPQEAIYADEESNLRIREVLSEFIGKHIRAIVKRVLYSYFLRDFNLVSLNIIAGILLTGFGATFGAVSWWKSVSTNIPATTGTVMIATLPIILGFQLLLSFASYDIANEPSVPLQRVTDPTASFPSSEGLSEC